MAFGQSKAIHGRLLRFLLITLTLALVSLSEISLCIRIPDRISETARNPNPSTNRPLKTAIFALGSFWRSESVFGCLNGVVRTTAGYAGGSKINPEYRSLGGHAESVQVSLRHSLLHCWVLGVFSRFQFEIWYMYVVVHELWIDMLCLKKENLILMRLIESNVFNFVQKDLIFLIPSVIFQIWRRFIFWKALNSWIFI